MRKLLALVVATGVLAGCGSGGADTRSSAAPSSRASASRANPADVAVIRAWSDALRRGDVLRAAGYFALPSVMINGPDANGQVLAVNIRTRAEAEAANSSLPCGARLLSARQRGRYIDALFRLTDRPGPGGGCGSGAGQTARTDFIISKGRIVDWVRAPSEPGDNANQPPGTPAPPAGGSSAPSV